MMKIETNIENNVESSFWIIWWCARELVVARYVFKFCEYTKNQDDEDEEDEEDEEDKERKENVTNENM